MSDEGLRESPPRLRIGVYTRDCFGDHPEQDVFEVCERAAALCASLGHDVVRVEMPILPDQDGVEAILDLMAVSVSAIVAQITKMIGGRPAPEMLEPYTWMLAKRGETLGEQSIVAARQKLIALGDLAAEAFNDVDILLSPTVPFTAFPLGNYAPDKPFARLKHHFQRSAAYTAPASLSGFPAMTVPLFNGRSGLPAGSHFVARTDQEALLFRLAFQLEKACPWAPRLNDLSRKLAA